jgi:hypothetical protein
VSRIVTLFCYILNKNYMSFYKTINTHTFQDFLLITANVPSYVSISYSRDLVSMKMRGSVLTLCSHHVHKIPSMYSEFIKVKRHTHTNMVIHK